jgi:hypothetical protein
MEESSCKKFSSNIDVHQTRKKDPSGEQAKRAALAVVFL